MPFFTRSGCVATSAPATSAVPAVGLRSPHSMRMVVVFPEPLGPRMPKISRVPMSKVTPSTALTAPKCLTRPSTWTATPGRGDARAAGGSVAFMVGPRAPPRARTAGGGRRGSSRGRTGDPHLDRQPRLERPAGRVHGDLDREHQVGALLLGQGRARRELGAAGDGHDAAREGAVAEALGEHLGPGAATPG